MENKTSRYFKYAIGEIILVVIGILIALQINNWNDNRIQKQNALILCERLLEETENTLPIIEADIIRCKDVLSADLSILNMMGENYRDQDSRKLDSLMSFTLLGPNLNVKNSVLNQALNNAALMNKIEVDLKNTIYEIPVLVEAAKKTESSIRIYVNEMVSIMSSTFSLRTMDATFSPSMKDVGLSKFNKDSREILSVFKFENTLDNKYFLINALTENYRKVLAGYEALKHELQSNIEQLN